MKKVAIFGSRHQNTSAVRIERLLEAVAGAASALFMHSVLYRHLTQMGIDVKVDAVFDELPECDLIISLGGDGTFLRSARRAGRSGIPVMGVNTGHLGFLANFTIDDTEAVSSVVRGESGVVEARTLLEVKCGNLPENLWPYALNELAVLKAETSSMINVRANIGDTFLADYLADGVVVSTPTGSTAYNLSAGGPIIEPTLNCVVVSPIAPHSLTMRPLVISGEDTLNLLPTSRDCGCRISIDGQSVVMGCGEVIKVRRAPFCSYIVRHTDDHFATILRDKLLWGRREYK